MNGRRNRCKGPEAGVSLACSMNKAASVAGADEQGGKGWRRMAEGWEVIVRIVAFTPNEVGATGRF